VGDSINVEAALDGAPLDDFPEWTLPQKPCEVDKGAGGARAGDCMAMPRFGAARWMPMAAPDPFDLPARCSGGDDFYPIGVPVAEAEEVCRGEV